MELKDVQVTQVQKNRFMVKIVLPTEIDWEKLVAKNPDIEYNPEIQKMPCIKIPNVATIIFLRKTIQIFNPRPEDCIPLALFAQEKVKKYPRHRRWLAFITDPIIADEEWIKKHIITDDEYITRKLKKALGLL